MPLDTFRDFFIACVGASASFIGLLFVSLSIILARDSAALKFRDRRLAESSFMALSNIFFLSLETLLPTTNIGYISILFALIGIWSSFRIFSLRDVHHATATVAWFSVSLLIYGLQIIYAARMIANPSDIGNVYAISTIILVLFGTGLLRAWELTGIRRR